jgi:hypothetical protein
MLLIHNSQSQLNFTRLGQLSGFESNENAAQSAKDQAEREAAESILRFQSYNWQKVRQARLLEHERAEYLALLGLEQTSKDLLRELQEMTESQRSLHGSLELSVSVVTTFGTLGYLLWSLRGGVLLTAAMSQLPNWRFIDPLPVLEHFVRNKKDEVVEDLDSLFGIQPNRSTSDSSQRESTHLANL